MMEQWHPKDRQYIALSVETIALSADVSIMQGENIAAPIHMRYNII
jgi:hypothetical protein